MISVLIDIEVVPKLEYFMADNAGNNDTAVRAICRQLRSDIKNPDSRRVRCLDHIINLSAKTFLFEKDSDAFKLTINNIRKLSKLEILRASWRKLKPVDKFHNTIKFIKIISQCQEEFLNLLKSEIAKNIKSKLKLLEYKHQLTFHIKTYNYS